MKLKIFALLLVVIIASFSMVKLTGVFAQSQFYQRPPYTDEGYLWRMSRFDQNQNSIGQYMDRMMRGELSPEDQRTMGNMMQRMMGGNYNPSDGSVCGADGYGNYRGGGSWWGIWAAGFGITLVLLWILLIGMIVRLWQRITKKMHNVADKISDEINKKE